MQIAVLGAVEVCREGTRVDLGVRKQRALLAALALDPGRVVPAPALVALIWGDAAPPGALGTLQTYVAGLRRALDPERASRTTDGVLATVGAGYALRVPADAVDAVRFERSIAAARVALGAAAADLLAPGAPPDLDRARAELAAARALWRDAPYPELGEAPAAVAARARLAELRVVAEELTSVVRLGDGDSAALAADLERLTAEHPLRERLWALRALALTRAGRQADALAALRAVRAVLADELGVDPGPELRRVEEAVLRQDAVATSAAGLPARAMPPSAPPVAALPRPAPWPLVGRTTELARLTGLLDAAATGRPVFAALVGDPGIGKSRLATELSREAERRGALVLTGRCSQDEGAPPLWPWTSVLAALPGGAAAPGPVVEAPDADPQGGRFRTWDAITQRVLAAAADRLVLLVLDDLHWADASSLRVLRHLVAAAEGGRLAVVASWRRHPGPTGPLAEVAEALARRHAVRVQLEGLPAGDAAALVAAVAGEEVSTADRLLLARRTDGNPFFLVEYARLAQETDRPLVDELPAAVSDVLTRRLSGLPEPSLAVLRVAAVLGREVRVPLLAAVAALDEEHVLDVLEAALTAGLLVEDGVDRFRFAHALVRDAAYGTLLVSRRARLHARAATAWEAREDDPQAAGEIARHWLAAGPAAAARAWPAAVTAAEHALALHAHEEARDLLRAALTAQPDDPAAGWRQRYDLLMALAGACRAAADWSGLSDAVDEAIAVAGSAGDIERTARAAMGVARGALWQPRGHGEVHQPVVEALRSALRSLPPGDDELRCRVMLSLAAELYYAVAPAERAALVDEALAMARRLGQDDLLLDALVTAYVATWWPSSATDRLALADEAAAVARATGDAGAAATAETLRAVVLGELGRVAEMWRALDSARRGAAPLRMVYLLLVLDALEAPWLAMTGRAEEAEQVLARLVTRFEQTGMPQAADGVSGAVLAVRIFQGRLAEALPRLMDLVAGSRLPVAPVVTAMLLRIGDVDGARAMAGGIDLSGQESWYSVHAWCSAGEAALGLGDPALGAAAYARAAPYAGRVCVAGSGAPLGPVDAFLALAAAAAGETATASAHADRALELCVEWRIPLVAQWLRDQRDRYGF